MRRLFPFVCVAALACPLPAKVLYRCEDNGTCAQPDFVCGADLYCYPAAEATDGGGPDGGPCVPRDLTGACGAVECGFIDDGCGTELDCAKDCPAPLECGVQQPNRCALPRPMCTAEGWCWEHPLPQGLSLFASLRLDARHLWFVGEGGVVLFFDGEKSAWQDAPVPPGTDLVAIHGTRPDDVFAVGTNGVIVHFDGTRWELEGAQSGVTATLRTVWSFGDGGAFAAGLNGRLVSRNLPAGPAARWRLEVFPNAEEIRDVFTDGTGKVYAVTRRGQLFAEPEGSVNSWALVDTAPLLQETLTAVVRPNGLTLGGVPGPSRATVVRRAPDGGWRALTDGGSAVVELVAGPTGLYALGSSGDFAFLDDADNLTRIPVTPGQWATAAPLAGARLMVAGPQGAMGVLTHDGGVVRSSPRLRPGHQLNAVCGHGPAAMFAVGGIDQTAACGGCRVRWLQRQPSPAGVQWAWYDFQLGGTTQLLGCYAEGPERVWFPGNDSKFILLAAGAPQYRDFGGGPLSGQYSGAWGTPAAGYYFTRRQERVVTQSDSGVADFSLLDIGATGDTQSVWGLGRDDVMVVGLNGSVAQWDGTAWAAAGGVAASDLTAVHGSRLPDGGRRFVAVGTAGVSLSFEGPRDGGPSIQVHPGVTFAATWVSALGTAWAAGRSPDGGAFVARSEAGGPWLAPLLSSPRPITGVFGLNLPDGGASVWVTGGSGMILRRD